MRKLALALAILGLVSCKKDSDEEQINYAAWTIVKVEGATAATVNQTIPVTVTYPFTSGCDIVDKFAESRGASTINITLLGHTRGNICTMIAGTRTIIYNFTATHPGTYELLFANNDAIIPHKIIVN